MGFKKVGIALTIGVGLLMAAQMGCRGRGDESPGSDIVSAQEERPRDPHSFSDPGRVRVTHLDLELDVDFDRKQLRGTAGLTLDNSGGSDELVLDTRGLEIGAVRRGEGTEGDEASFTLEDEVEHLGRPLRIEIGPDTTRVEIDYVTSPHAEALQWLAPAQTAGGHQPFLFTQSQAILARTWVPCQDSPAVRMTYSATVRVPPGLVAVMSATNGTAVRPDGVYEFEMTQPIPSYLLALAVGDLTFRELGPRSGVYAEPSVVDKAAWEFADVEDMIAAAERLYGPYRWDRYDLLVLPPSFPFGGMENPRLTFATPTILAGDRSLVSLVAHELAHSWSGNLVTNATWNDFWLNEGFTSYIENRIMEEIYGADYAQMLASLGHQDLLATIEDIGAEAADTHLFLDLAGRNPDDGMTDIAYEKGATLLATMEHLVGRKAWDSLVTDYFDAFAFRSVTTADFLEYLETHLFAANPDLKAKVQIQEWIHGPGLPDNARPAHSNAFDRVETALGALAAGTPAAQLDTAEWTTHHWLHLIRNLPDGIHPEQMADLDQAFSFTASGNSEIQCAWLTAAIANNYQGAYSALEEFLTRVGRRKFLKPLYTELAKTPAGLKLARRIYAQARPGYHAISTGTIDQILGWVP